MGSFPPGIAGLCWVSKAMGWTEELVWHWGDTIHPQMSLSAHSVLGISRQSGAPVV